VAGVVIVIADCRRHSGDAPDFGRFLLADPDWPEDVEFPRNRDFARDVDFD
jgi:2,4-dienoyl-CoA reductase-like NADH-dependent reductase (Old Yellow Enzyme family)